MKKPHDFLEEKQQLMQLLVVLQRSARFTQSAFAALDWPLSAAMLVAQQDDAKLFNNLAAVNERFAKHQDILSSAMRHLALIVGVIPNRGFLDVLAFYEKEGIIKSIELWQSLRIMRNKAAHEYDLDFGIIAEYFND